MKDKKLTRSELKRAAIVDAASVEFQNKGFSLASMDEIAKRADVSKRTVYNHFPSKEALFSAIMLEMMAMLCAFEVVPYRADEDLAVQLTQLVQHEIKLLSAKGFIDTSRVIIAEAIHKPELIQGAMSEFTKQESPLAGWFNQAIAAGALKAANSEVLVIQFTAVIKAFCFWPQLIQGEPLPSQAKLDEITQTVVEMIIKQYT
ncbi:TetR/AcrR family transcriptional regulator [Shewanella marisflavi]|uniref:TetR/AcrR family transcriptional regulator n=1 Tax=Shewanella TaxID=22 RepID=UPI003AAC7264